MSISLSHSAKERYLRCPLSYYMHYFLRLREEIIGSPLVFGTAVDVGVGVLGEGKTLTEALKEFDDSWENPSANGKTLVGPTTKLIRYSKADSKEKLADTPWECLKIKGHMMIEAYQKIVMPTIKDVLANQKKISIVNEQGDIIIGYADKVVELHNGWRGVMDDKTSSAAYKKDAVVAGDKAKQLALYFEALKDEYKLDGAGFYVMEKGIRVNEPRTRVQILTGVPPEEVIQKTFDEFENVLYNVRMGNFPSNTPNCNSYFGKCICEKYVRSEGANTSGLIKVK